MQRGIFGMLGFKRLSRKNDGKSQIPNTTIFVFISLVLVSTVMLLLSGRDFVSIFKNAGLSIFSGVRGGIYEVSSFFSRTVGSINELATLRKEHADLLLQLERFVELERSNAEILLENIRLKEQLDFSEIIRYNRIPAQILGRDPNNLFSAMVINKGSAAGIANNMTVVAYQNGIQALVGKVIQTGVFESLVMPVFDINSQISSRFSVSRFEGIIEGQGNSEFPLLMRFIPRRANDDINIGDIVVTSGMGMVFPAGINIGRVGGVNVLEYETTLEVLIIPMIDFLRLEYVFVLDVNSGEFNNTGS